MKYETVTLNKKDLLGAYKQADAKGKELLERLYPRVFPETDLKTIKVNYFYSMYDGSNVYQSDFINFISSLEALAWHLNPKDWKPDFDNLDEEKWGIGFTDHPYIDHSDKCQGDFFGVRFKTEELAQKALNILVNEGVIQKTFGV